MRSVANAEVKPPHSGAADTCKRSVKHVADATMWGRLERLVRRRHEITKSQAFGDNA